MNTTLQSRSGSPSERAPGLAGWAADIRRLLREPHDVCGFVIAQTEPVGERELRDLEAAVAAGTDDAADAASGAYEARDGLVTMLLPGRRFAAAHFAALRMKARLEEAGLLAGRLAVTSFPECAEPDERSLAEMLDLLAASAPMSGNGGVADAVADSAIVPYARESAPPAAGSIVVVEPDEPLTELLQVRLQLKGYDVHVAKDGMEGLRLVEDVRPDLVLTELTLPALDGYQLIHRIRQQTSGDGRHVSKIMVLTDKGPEREVQTCFDLGAADYVRKPFSPIELEARIRRLIG